jgi:DNA-binding GntR family transcriptional regulator
MNKSLFKDNSLSVLIKDHILREIILGKIQPEEKLIEAKYADEFGTSRAPVREAFYLLTLEGVAEKIPRKGTIVKGYSIEETYDLLEIRCYLETMSLEKIMNKNDKELLKKLEGIMLEMRQCTNGNEYAKLDYKFHYQIIIESGSDVVKTTYSRLGNILLTFQTLVFVEESYIKESIEEHEQILTCLYAKDNVKAKKLLNNHIKSVSERIKRNSTV